MSFKIRSAQEKDVRDLKSLASQFSLLNLPPDEDILQEKVERSIRSFDSQTESRADSEYLFVLEDCERQAVIGSSLILAKHGTEDSPHNYFHVRKEERFSQDLGIGFIHQVLRFGQDTDGPTEIGGLLIDRSYRRRPEKLGRQISLIRFLFIGMFPDKFESKLLCEFAPPLTRSDRSEFWESIGRRFTGLNYQEADLISRKDKEFIKSLFPTGDIYSSLLDTRARQVMGHVSDETLPAQHLLKNLGFQYLNDIDPFDGGPHYGVKTADVPIVKNTHSGKVVNPPKGPFRHHAFVGCVRDGSFSGSASPIEIDGSSVSVPASVMKILGLETGETLFYSPTEV